MRIPLKLSLIISVVVLAIIAAAFSYCALRKQPAVAEDQIKEEHLNFSSENVQVYRATNPEKGLLIYIADKSEGRTIIEYAKKFASLSYYVAVIDNDSLLNSPANAESGCLDLAKKLGNFKSQLQKHYQFDADENPILVGTNQSSATVYAALAQTKDHNFHAAVSINFSEQLRTHTTLCGKEIFSNPDNGLLLAPVKRLPTSFYVFQDKNYFPGVGTFSDKIANLKLTVTTDEKQNTLEEAIQILQWLDPRLADQISSDASDSDLPLIEVPASEPNAQQSTNDSLVVLLTGDGGWAEIDKSLANILAEKGVPTVALDSLSYFWKARTPEETAKDVEDIISTYLEKWHKKRVMLIGYSFGADALPFIANRLAPETQQKVSLIALLGMGKTAAFEFRLSSWMNADTHASRLPLLPEIANLKWANSICIYGIEDDAANCLPTVELGVKEISMTGDHHFDERYEELAQHILQNEKAN
jgi:type IV secretory pathway VirJ component